MEIGIFAAFVAGVISFLSPCVLPLVPGYISMLSGVGVEQLKRGEAPRGSLLLSALAFVLGFTVVFVAFGASASAVGQFLQKNRGLLTPIAGALVIMFGLHLIGWMARIPAKLSAVIGGVLLLAGMGLRALSSGATTITLGPLPALNWVYFASASLIFLLGPPLSKFLNRDVRLHSVGGRPGIVGGFLLGFAFAFGWTPCIGPILAGVLAIAATQESIGRGVFLLAVYSAGLAIPFLATAIGLSGFLQFYQRFRRHLHTVEVLSGVLLLFVGGLIFSNRLTWLSSKFAFLEDIVKTGEAAMLRGGGAGTAANPAHANLSDAPRVTFKDLEGKDVKMEDFRGKLVLVNFWATWCGPCREEMPSFIEFQETYGPRGFTILGASMDEGGVKDVKPWLEKERFLVNGQKVPVNYPMVLGTDDIAEEFGGLIGMPTSLLISRDGKILMRYIGVVKHDRLKADIEANLN